jgi:hypothetical protein
LCRVAIGSICVVDEVYSAALSSPQCHVTRSFEGHPAAGAFSSPQGVRVC